MDASSHIPLDDGTPIDFAAIEVVQYLIEHHNAIFTDANETVWRWITLILLLLHWIQWCEYHRIGASFVFPPPSTLKFLSNLVKIIILEAVFFEVGWRPSFWGRILDASVELKWWIHYDFLNSLVFGFEFDFHSLFCL